MKDSASLAPQMLHPEQDLSPKTDEKPWLRQKGEPARLYMWFRRYLDLGPKRSLRAAVSAEPNTQKATKSTGQNQETKKKLSDVSVPGAWKRASKVWRWVQRAEAYDLDQMEKHAGFIRQVVTQQPFASKAYRIIQLCVMASALLEQAKNGMALDAYHRYTVRMQSLLRDIARELEGIDETTNMMADASAYKHLLEIAKKQKS